MRQALPKAAAGSCTAADSDSAVQVRTARALKDG